LAISGSGQRVHLYETRAWEEVNAFRGHSEEVWAAVFAHDGRTLLTGAKDMTIRGWAVATNQQPVSRRLPSDLTSAFLLPDGNHLYVTHNDQSCSLWSTDPLEELERFPARQPDCAFSKISSGGKRWLGVNTNGVVRVFDRMKGQVLMDLPGPFVSAYRFGIALSPDGQMLAGVGTDHICRVWQVGELQEMTAFKISADTVSAVEFLGDGSLLAVGGWAGEAEIWDSASGQKVATLSGHKWMIPDFAITRDGSRVLTSSGDGRVKVWDLKSGREIATLGGQLNTCWAVALSPDETRVAACSGDGSVKLWDIETKQEVASLRIHNSMLRQLAFNDDGSLIVLSDDPFGQARLFVLRAPPVSQP
jgi:WD40 repeat protein